MKHFEFNGTWGECLNKIDESPFLGLKDLHKKAHIVIDIHDEEDEKKVRSQVVRTQPDTAKKP